MKRRFLLISMCAAVMFSTSCSKEDNESVDTKEVNNQTEVNATKAITVSAKQKSSVSKVALGNKNGNKYEEVFSEGEVLKLYLNGDEIASLDIQSGQGTTTATFSGEIPVSADGQTISAKILPSYTPSGLTKCDNFAAAVSTYASLSGTFAYNVNDDEFSLTLYDEVSYFVVETNMEEVDINEKNYTVSNGSVVFAFNANQEITSTKLGLTNQALTAGGNVYFKIVNVIAVGTVFPIGTADLGNYYYCSSMPNGKQNYLYKDFGTATIAIGNNYTHPTLGNFRMISISSSTAQARSIDKPDEEWEEATHFDYMKVDNFDKTPTGIKIKSGSGTEDDPFTFEIVLPE